MDFIILITAIIGAVLGIINTILIYIRERPIVSFQVLYKCMESENENESQNSSNVRKKEEYHSILRITNKSPFPVYVQEIGTIENKRDYNPFKTIINSIDARKTVELDTGIYANSLMQSDWVFIKLGDDKIIKKRIPQRISKIGKHKVLVLFP